VSSLASEEGALLEECILTGMPTTLDKQEEEALLNECIQAGMPSGSSNIRSGEPIVLKLANSFYLILVIPILKRLSLSGNLCIDCILQNFALKMIIP